MGNNSSEQPKNKCEVNIQPPHEMLNNTKIMRKEGRPVLLSQWPFFSKDVFRLWEKQYSIFITTLFGVKQLQNSRQPLVNNLFLPFTYHYSNLNVCSPTGLVIMQYQLPGKNLMTDIEARNLRNEPYKEHQIWILIYQLAKMVQFLHQKEVSGGDIRPENIFVDFQKRNIKLSTEVSWIGQPTFVNKIANNSDIFVAPEILKTKELDQQLKRSYFISNDDFSIGMTLAQCILLEDLSKIYEIENHSRKMNQLKYIELVNKILGIKYYSWKLLFIVVGMIQLKFKQRINCFELCQLLKHSKKHIMKCQEFQITKEQFLHQIPSKYKILEGKLEKIDYKAQNNSIVGSRVSSRTKKYLQHQLSGFSHNTNPPLQHKPKQHSASYNSQLSLAYSSVTPYSENPTYHPQNYCFQGKPHKINGYLPNNVQKQSKFSCQNKISFAKDSSIHFAYANANTSQKLPQSTEAKSDMLDQLQAVSVQKHFRINQEYYIQSPRFPNDNDKNSYIYDKEPRVQLFSDNPPRIGNETKKDDQCFSAIHKLEEISVSKSNQTLLLPSVYNVSNSPESYISYHYTKSITPKQRKMTDNERDQCLSFDTQVFNLENDIPDSFDLKMKSQEVRKSSQKNLTPKLQEEYKRRTIGFSER